MPDIIVKQQPTTSLTVQSNSTQIVIRQAAANNITVATTGNSYVLPAATNSTLGGIIVGSNLTIANGVLSATSSGGGVTAFNNRTGNVSLTANDVTTVANGIYIADASAVSVPVSYGNDLFYGQYQTRHASPGFPFVAGGLLTNSRGIVGVSNTTDPCNIEFHPGESFNQMRFRSYDKIIVLNNDGFSVETGTANWTWSANSILTQGRGDVRYQPVGSYLTTANAATTYLPSVNFTYANIGGTIPTATNTTLGAVKVGSNLTIANGVLSATSSGGFQNGDTLNGGTY